MTVCPYESKFNFSIKCPVDACPYSYAKMSQIFKLQENNTNCSLLDNKDLAKSLLENNPLLATSKSNEMIKGYRSIRREADLATEIMRSLYKILHNEPPKHYCTKCGAPKCVNNSKECAERLEWVDKVCLEVFNITPTHLIRANIWALLKAGQLEIGTTVLPKQGQRLLATGENT